MKTKFLLALSLIPIMVIANNDLRGHQKDSVKINHQKPPKNKRYRLADKSKNYFNVGNDRIRIQVPVTNRKLRVTNWIENISSSDLNAVLIWIKAKNIAETPCNEEYTFKPKSIRISKLKGLRDQLQPWKNKEIIIAFWINDEEPTYQIENEFREMIRTSKDYKEAIEKINRDNCSGESIIKSKFELPFKPAESGGDVIGGNG